MALLGLLAVALGWAAMQYRQFSADISQSRNRLPASVDRALPAAPPGALDAPEVTLVRYTSALSTAGAVLFFTDPKGRLMFVSGPPAEHTYRQPVTGSPRRADDDRRSSSLDRGAGRPRCAHRPVARRKPRVRPRRHHDHESRRRAGDPARRPSDNRSAEAGFRSMAPGAVAYLRRSADLGNRSRTRVWPYWAASFKELLRPNSVGTLDAAGSALASSASTDLTDADVLGLAYLRVRRGHRSAVPPRRQSRPHLDPCDQRTGAVPGLQTARAQDACPNPSRVGRSRPPRHWFESFRASAGGRLRSDRGWHCC